MLIKPFGKEKSFEILQNNKKLRRKKNKKNVVRLLQNSRKREKKKNGLLFYCIDGFMLNILLYILIYFFENLLCRKIVWDFPFVWNYDINILLKFFLKK